MYTSRCVNKKKQKNKNQSVIVRLHSSGFQPIQLQGSPFFTTILEGPTLTASVN